jgi:non-heme chloroperoxidase
MMASCRVSDGVELHYQMKGSGEPTVVLIHGWMVHAGVWEQVLERWPNDSGQILVLDLRGAGQSGRREGTYTLSRYAQDIVELMDHVGKDQAWLVGHSMGGVIAARVAASHPSRVRGLLLFAPVPPSGFPLTPEAVAFFRGVADDSARAEDLLKGLVASAKREEVVPRLVRLSGAVDPAAIREGLDAWRLADFAAEARQYQGPVWVWAGAEDPYLSESFLRSAFQEVWPQAVIGSVAACNHYIPVEDSAAVVRHIVTVTSTAENGRGGSQT